ncbi:DUF305 domain-containing protein [Micromonospora sp. NBC_01796]|uniref:DUF305 domain-containing protein n=1 Tax=Micromonospora sp. NBC_01796 TaxID=2975987 RepID=UPI002DD8EA0A|nr:DUF305 domain-containing protein [Micromonospora sp. NBC_01796]WSA87822.1 DUF305 domain-containing protein [Micromonospora sp. NBC_01796]
MARYRRTLLAPVVLLLLAGCGGASTAPGGSPAGPTPAPQPVVSATATGSPGPFNPADVMFLQMMVTHHGQGLELVRLAESRAQRAEVRTLAAAVDVTQTEEQETMRGWLRNWGQPTEADPADHAHADHGGLPATGPEQIAALGRITGAEFETAFLNLFIAHQHNAVEMARNEAKFGQDPAARELAGRIDQSRTAQINQMLTMLG